MEGNKKKKIDVKWNDKRAIPVQSFENEVNFERFCKEIENGYAKNVFAFEVQAVVRLLRSHF